MTRALRLLLQRRVLRLPLHVWLLWGGAAAVLAACPMLLSDPGMWPYLLDPELLALVVIVGARYSRIELTLARIRLEGLIRRCYGRGSSLIATRHGGHG